MASLESLWKDLLWKCYHQGKDVKKDDSEIRELMGNFVFIERPQDVSHPIFQNVDSKHLFLDFLEKGLYDIEGYPFKGEALYDYVTSLDKSDHIFCSDAEERATLKLNRVPFVYTYPERLMHHFTTTSFMENDCFDVGWVDQLKTVADRLKKNMGSNRAVATLYHPGIDRKRDDIPCLNWIQFTVRGGKLAAHVMFRSNDLFGAWPANMYLITYLGLCIAERIGVSQFCGIYYHSSSLHIYKSNFEEVEKILNDK